MWSYGVISAYEMFSWYKYLIVSFINQYWNLLNYSQSESVRQLYKCRPIVAYKRPTNLQDMLVHSELNRKLNSGSVSKCNRPRCSHCSSIVESNSVSSTTASAAFNVRENFSCASSDVIYLITCKKMSPTICWTNSAEM